MYVDCRNLENPAPFEADVCIVGAGPTGLSLATELSESGLRVAVLETGGLGEMSSATLDLSRGEVDPESGYYPLESICGRQVGGTTTIWDAHVGPHNRGARFVPLDPIDFEKREAIPHSGWPVTREQMDPFYARAQAHCGIGPYCYEVEDWSKSSTPAFALPDHLVQSAMFQIGSGHVFYETHAQRLMKSASVTIYAHATATQLELDAAGQRLSSVHAKTLSGVAIEVKARAFALTMGGMETPKLLLASPGKTGRGVGNERDMVGRYFMDHPLVHLGWIKPSDPSIFQTECLYDWREVRGTTVCGHLKLSPAVMRERGLMSIGAKLLPRLRVDESPGIRAVASTVRELSQGKVPSREGLRNIPQAATELRQKLWTKATAPRELDPPINQGGWSHTTSSRTRFDRFEVLCATEQAPDPNNRIELADETDPLGCRRAKVSWTWSEFDQRSLLEAQQVFEEAFREANIGEFQPLRDNGRPVARAPGMHHPMGGARMSESPETGVVDAQCRVHEVANLFIAGGAVFPTGGFANPTLSMIATAMIVADQLRAQCA